MISYGIADAELMAWERRPLMLMNETFGSISILTDNDESVFLGLGVEIMKDV